MHTTSELQAQYGHHFVQLAAAFYHGYVLDPLARAASAPGHIFHGGMAS